MSGPERAEPPPSLLRVLVDAVPAMLAYWDAGLRCRFANRAYQTWFGIAPEAMIGRRMEEILGPLFALNRPYIEGALRGEPQEFEREIPDPAGGPPRYSQAHYVPDVVDGTVRGFCVLVADITRRKRAEEAVQEMAVQLQATERLAALATLAAGIAHEINNPLASVLGNLELALEELAGAEAGPDALAPPLADAREGAQRIREIVQSMKLLARGDAARRERIDVDAAVEKSVGFAANTLRYRARVATDLGGAGWIEGNAGQLSQVLLNLLANAAQSFPEPAGAGNEVRVSTRRAGGEVVIEVADNGRGIPEALQSRIFDPFFTTKGVGEGTGLGLAISRGIVGSLGGQISVRSKPGEGSVFTVLLPGAPEPAAGPAARAAAAERAAPSAAPHAARPLVLVVDDEAAVATLVQRALGRDCDVVVANHGRAALDALAARRERPFELILCDLMMPELSGEEVYAEAVRRWPDLARRFVIMTGGAFTERGRAFLDRVPVPVLEKPFEIARVRALIAAAAAQPGAAAGGAAGGA